MTVLMAGESTRTVGPGRVRSDWCARELELVERLRVLRARAAVALGVDTTLPTVEWDVPRRSVAVVAELAHACLDRLHTTTTADVEAVRELGELLLGFQGLVIDWYLGDTAMRSQRLAGCATALSRLSTLPNSAALIEGACQELVTRCGFHRAVLSTVEAGAWKPMILLDRSEPAEGSWFQPWRNQTIPLEERTPEAEARARRRPALIQDTDDAPVFRPLIVQAGRSRSYVVAPIVLGSDVIGFLHTDHHPHSRRVGEGDRDVLWAFADGFSHIYERAVLLERIRAHRDSVRELFFGAVGRLDALCESGFSTSLSAEQDRGLPFRADAQGFGRDARVELTEREVEVFELMVTGASNQEIADRLVITEGTVKSHVKHILRKYGAVNRAQAIAIALRQN
ncbi:LuxR family transcriptional regulator [Mycolicibacterium insubricum]|uniref:Helix-turn-helix transcriptional regulator n=1 Tax=Mycolicibacterium insubricum TaxID=444597 RepID=A0A1X0D5V4_9MYCO|nr:helix-turn-helix transcriptional regulator [Mycolicibacterium sp.]MCV7080024.1 helix-turn-helix transcriptional regulator [Mycolicibacterium insubricum]ORA67120.1 helix-turn-helix transcriptional regulator [Mycolicibacterium insubricum]BBZ65980.1 LuxR family transcriptional regulator [Mycolicibacterium insubricum]